MGRDRLDGSRKKSILVEVFLAPGRMILWLTYMSPGKGYGNVRKSARHARSPLMTFFYSLGFYGLLIASWYTGPLQEVTNWVMALIDQMIQQTD